MAREKEDGRLRPRQLVGKYRIDRRLATGGFAYVYEATDTIEGIKVALKIPRAQLVARHGLADFKKEVRVVARLDHPNILPIKNADFIDGVFVIASPLGERTLGDRLKTRISAQTALDYAEQILDAVAYAHERRVIHCDIKPENFVLFDDSTRIRMTDFGIARLSFRTMMAGSGSGTVGYLAPEQAMGKLSFRSDVFSTGLVLYRMFSGHLPEWPFDWPPAGHANLRRKLHAKVIDVLRRSMRVDAKRRYASGEQMLNAFARVKPLALQVNGRRKKRRSVRREVDFDAIRWKAFAKRYKRALEARHECSQCGGPVAEHMSGCPWCGNERKRHPGETQFPATCPRCRRGVKLDWKFCAWCYGPAIGPISDRTYSDKRYVGRCANRACERRELMPFMRYCPWCRRKTQKPWKIHDVRGTCRRCGWGVLLDYWEYCPWCTSALRE